MENWCLALCMKIAISNVEVRITHKMAQFPIVHAEWSLVFWSFRIMLCRVEKDCFKLNNDNNNR